MMKKIIFMILILSMFLSGCQDVRKISEQTNSSNKITSTIDFPSQTIEVRSLEDFNKMKEMSVCDDESQLQQYFQSFTFERPQSKEDISAFVNLIDSMPIIPILDGNIVWICFSRDISKDTGKETTVVYISTEAANGDWTRIEYVFSVDDIPAKISVEKSEIENKSLLNSPIKNSDGNLTLHIETRNPHPSGNGTMIQWVGETEGIFTRIYYFTNNSNDIETKALFSNIKMSKIYK